MSDRCSSEARASICIEHCLECNKILVALPPTIPKCIIDSVHCSVIVLGSKLYWGEECINWFKSIGIYCPNIPDGRLECISELILSHSVNMKCNAVFEMANRSRVHKQSLNHDLLMLMRFCWKSAGQIYSSCEPVNTWLAMTSVAWIQFHLRIYFSRGKLWILQSPDIVKTTWVWWIFH